MSVIVEIAVPPDEFALAEAFDIVPEMTLEVQRIAAHGVGSIFPLCWLREGDREAVESAMRTDSTISRLTMLDRTADARLYWIRWAQRVRHLLYIIMDNATVLAATGTVDRWTFRMLFESYDPVSEFRDSLVERDVTFSLNRLFETTAADIDGVVALTRKQREILITAYGAGYFETPREITMGDLAEELDISQQAASTRLRRAHSALIRATLPVDPEDIDR